MLCEYSHTKSESLAEICATMAEIQHFILGDCFLLAHPVYYPNNFSECLLSPVAVFIMKKNTNAGI